MEIQYIVGGSLVVLYVKSIFMVFAPSADYYELHLIFSILYIYKVM